MQDLAGALTTALTHQREGRLAAAEAGYLAVLEAEPGQPNALYLYGATLLASGRAGEAVPYLTRAVALRPAETECRVMLANALHASGDPGGAVAVWAGIVAGEPGHEAASLNLAAQHRAEGDWPGAVDICREALARRPMSQQLWLALAQALLAGQIDDAALTAADAALELNEALSEAWLIRGTVLARRRDFGPALAALHRCLALDASSARAALHLGNALIDQDRLAEAEPWLFAAIRRDPDLAEAHTSLGFLRSSQQRLPEAIACHRQALVLRPTFADAHSNLAASLLLAGNFAEGFSEYEWRKHNPLFSACYWASDRPAWSGEPLAGRTILVFCEQGLGDTLMCARFLPELHRRGGRIVLVCPPPLIPLLETMPGVVAVVPRGEPRHGLRVAEGATVPAYNTWVDQMSLAHVIGVTPTSIPGAAGYLQADPRRVAAWHARLPDRFRIGVVWAGNPTHSNDHRRSLPLPLLAPLLRRSGVTWISLQRDAAEGEAAAAGMLDAGSALRSFADTAAVLACLDLVVSVDSAVAHLAGAMGRATWLMLPYAAEWRWMVGRSDTPWYTKHRLFRQQAAGDWGAVVRDLGACLDSWAASSTR